jgi:hypothetical protein
MAEEIIDEEEIVIAQQWRDAMKTQVHNITRLLKQTSLTE